MFVVCLCHITLIYLLYHGLSLIKFFYYLRNDVMINVKYNTFDTAILWENIKHNTFTLEVKCYNSISVCLRILSVIVRLYHESGSS